MVILQHRQSTGKQKEVYKNLLKVSDNDVRIFCKEGSDEFMALPAKRKAKNFIISAYVMRQRKEAYLRFMKWYEAKERFKMILDPQWKLKNPKLAEYIEKIPIFE